MRDPRSGWIQLSAAEFSLVWSALNLGPIPTALGIPRLGRTARTRADLNTQASATLNSRDLGTVGQPAKDVAIPLHVLAGHEKLVEMTVDGQESSLAAVVGSGQRGTAVAARVGDEVRVGPVERITGALLDAVVPLPAGPGSSVNIRVADFDTACAAGERDGISGFSAELGRAGIRPRDASMVAKALTTRLGGGRLGVTHSRVRTAFSWVDTPDGRYVLRTTGDWVTVTPVDPPRLAALVDDTVV
ncbi:ESX secretion-associated protein EspG [Actinocrispum wychmicini]|uniref:ESAT-6 protein secretion system EspG family protein n=1 Tax=Actinocrispum wychmicini TaxID=1213861 RepID=A0A4R2JVD6_9PSEU|nr:ESX secretion-associated protein EspG [Actinocrispum wychmicini]TCO64421.1 ESAT-6 protein secretion system EspG family protein [Actinocrispum wychmicini]